MKTQFDPREARRFAAFLDECARDLRSLNVGAAKALFDLHAAHWQDGRFEQFERLYEEASVSLQQFIEYAERYAEYLRRKAEPIERYLNRRY